MSGDSAFTSMMGILSRGSISVCDEYSRVKISKKQYEEFEQHWIWYALRDWRYGRAFCEHFGIDNATPLYHFKDDNLARRWIHDNYIEHEAEIC